MKLDFTHATLYASVRSPFARRVRLALIEHGVPYTERMLDPWQPQPELIALNPLNRVPTLELASGEVLVESSLILAAFYESKAAAGEVSPWLPTASTERLEAYRISALAIGLIEKTIEYFLEMQRAPEARDGDLIAEAHGLFDRTLAWLETRLARRGSADCFIGERLTQSDLDLGTALEYYSFRAALEWRSQYPRLAAYAALLGRRASFLGTRPDA